MTECGDFNDFAIFGSIPTFQEKLHVGRPNIGNRKRLLNRINDILDRKWLTNNGPYVRELEQSIAAILGVKHCIAVCNGTIALEIVIRALELTGEVIIPSFTFIATAHALQWQRITPVFADIDPESHNLDPKSVEEKITPSTSGIIPVHLWGRPADLDALKEISQRRNLRLLCDAAHALGCSYKGRMIGNFGDAEVFSFHATKFIHTFEGGAVVTNNGDLALKIRSMKDFGYEKNDVIARIGTNGKMNEISAAMGLTLLESMHEIIEVNRLNYKHYQDGLAGLPGINMVTFNESEKNNYQYIVLAIDEAAAGINRDILWKVLQGKNVLARRYFYPGCHREKPYRNFLSDESSPLPETEKLCEKVLLLPTGSAVCPEDIRKICQIIRTAVKH